MSRLPKIKSESGGYCRICQRYDDGVMFDILGDFLEIMRNINELQATCEAFTKATGIQVSVDDGLSRFVCGECFARLQDMLLLRQQAKECHQKSIVRRMKNFECKGALPQCLICMGHDDRMTDVFSDLKLELAVDYVRTLSHLFEEIVGIPPWDYDRGEKLLCGGCVDRLTGSGSLRQQAAKSYASQIEKSQTENTIEIKQETFDCQKCLQTFDGNLEYESHMPCGSQTPTNQFHDCPVCGKSFGHKQTLKMHLLNHSLDLERASHVCDICSKAFQNASDLTEHQEIHSRQRSFVCDICQKSFENSSYLNAHKTTIHHDEQPFECNICSKTFKTEQTLKIHIAEHHNKDRPYVCEICSKTFKFSGHLSNHIQTHSEKYKCKICSKCFRDSVTLTEHNRIHTKQKAKSLFCGVCSKHFRRNSALWRHQQTHKSSSDTNVA